MYGYTYIYIYFERGREKQKDEWTCWVRESHTYIYIYIQCTSILICKYTHTWQRMQGRALCMFSLAAHLPDGRVSDFSLSLKTCTHEDSQSSSTARTSARLSGVDRLRPALPPGLLLDDDAVAASPATKSKRAAAALHFLKSSTHFPVTNHE